MILSRIIRGVACVGLLMAATVFNANATVINLNKGDTNYVGSINDGIPASLSNEVGFINNLITLGTGVGDTTIGTEIYNRVGSAIGSLATAILTGAVKDETESASINLGSSFQYVLAKYDASQAGSLVWYFSGGISGDIAVQGEFNNKAVSHVSVFNVVTGTPPPPNAAPEPSILALLGLGLAGIGFSRRKAA